VAANSSI